MSSWITLLSNTRIQQLEHESKIDKKLTECNFSCPEETLLYLLNMRKLNRSLSSEVYNSSFYSYPSKIASNLKTVDDIQSHLIPIEVGSCPCFCEQLKAVNKRIKILMTPKYP